MKPKAIKHKLTSAIKLISSKPDACCFNPGKDFSRTRKINVNTLISGLIGMEGKSLSNELIDLFDKSSDIPTPSAFVQQRVKLKPQAMYDVFRVFTDSTSSYTASELTMLAIDGSEIRIPDNPEDESTRIRRFSNSDPYNSLHLNALYDINRGVYTDILIQNGAQKNEHRALQQMVDSSIIPKALVLADRGYESYNNMAHIQEKGWYFLIRIKDGNHGIKTGFSLPEDNEFDLSIKLKITRRHTKEAKKLQKDKNQYRCISNSTPFDYLPSGSVEKAPSIFYSLNFRIVRFRLNDDTYETILTNLSTEEYPPDKIKRLYAARWGIETSFRNLKYTLALLKFHSKKTVCICQEIYARLIMYNFIGMITSHVIIEKKERKYNYKVNFSTAAHACRLFFLGRTQPSNLESVIASFLIPIRTDRHRKRFAKHEMLYGFFYRIA